MPARTPEDCDRLFAERASAGDLSGLLELYEPGATLVLDGKAVVGREALREALTPLISLRPTLRMEIVRVLRSGDDLAALYNDWRMTATAPDGTPVERAGRAIEIVRRQPDGTWRFAIDDPHARG